MATTNTAKATKTMNLKAGDMLVLDRGEFLARPDGSNAMTSKKAEWTIAKIEKIDSVGMKLTFTSGHVLLTMRGTIRLAVIR